MPNHWHMVLRSSEDGLMGRMLRWVTATHTQRYHAHYHTAGEGHLYQPLSELELAALRESVGRGRPFGEPTWTAEVAQRTGLAYTLRPRGRPRKQQE